MTYVFGGTLSLTQSINLLIITQILARRTERQHQFAVGQLINAAPLFPCINHTLVTIKRVTVSLNNTKLYNE